MEVNLLEKKHKFIDTTATKKIFELRKRIRAVAGGTSASKTFSILIWLIDYCTVKQDGEKLATIVSESFPHLDGGAILDFKNLMKDRHYWDDARWNETRHFYTFETGNKLEFLSADNSKAHGPRRDVLFLNECNHLDFNVVDQLIVRTRETVWMDWNPSEEFFFYTEMLPKRDDIDFITLTYLDNEALDPITIKEIESHKNNPMWWACYGEGKLGTLENRIYKGWNFIDDIEHEARMERVGLDFGYSVDPTAIVDIYKYNGSFIFDERTYLKGLSNRHISDILLGVEKTLVVGDSAEPKSIDEIKGYGVNIVGAVKGAGSVNQGIQFIQDQRISVTKRSLNIIKEYRNYCWMKDSRGDSLPTPAPGLDHCMDAIRYALSSYKPTMRKGAQPVILRRTLV